MKTHRDEVMGQVYAIDKCRDKLSQLRKDTNLIKSEKGENLLESVNKLCNLLDEVIA